MSLYLFKPTRLFIGFGILTESKILDLATHLINLVAPKTLADPLDSQAIDFVDYMLLKAL